MRAHRYEHMAEDWSRAEVEATVAEYFSMLGRELRGAAYNKSEHRRHLSKLLNGRRSDGAIERKHQNISAILLDLGFLWIPGYKPLRNYQQLLLECVADLLPHRADLLEVAREAVCAPAVVPTVDDILDCLIDPPEPDDQGRSATTAPAVRETHQIRKGVDYLAMEAANQLLGAAGEEFVVRFEMARLARAGCENLAAQVQRVSEHFGDGLGYDVLSFESSGRERLIEVKTTAYAAYTPFFVSRNELNVSREIADRFHLYRAFNFRKRPGLFFKSGPLDRTFNLRPNQYEAGLF